MTDAPKPRYRCPKCHQSDTLYEEVEVPGWRTVDEHLEPVGRDHDVDWRDVEGMESYGCSCGWSAGFPEQLGIDSEPLPYVHPGQITLA